MRKHFHIALACLALIGPVPLFYPFGAIFQGKGFSPPVFTNPLDHVADANARLSLDPTTHPTNTFQVIQDDDGLTYTFTGPGADADEGLMVDLVPWIANGTAGGKNYYNNVGLPNDPASNSIVYVVTTWARLSEFGGAVEAGTDANYPWLSTWDTSVVTRNPIASEANWTP